MNDQATGQYYDLSPVMELSNENQIALFFSLCNKVNHQELNLVSPRIAVREKREDIYYDDIYQSPTLREDLIALHDKGLIELSDKDVFIYSSDIFINPAIFRFEECKVKYHEDCFKAEWKSSPYEAFNPIEKRLLSSRPSPWTSIGGWQQGGIIPINTTRPSYPYHINPNYMPHLSGNQILGSGITYGGGSAYVNGPSTTTTSSQWVTDALHPTASSLASQIAAIDLESQASRYEKKVDYKQWEQSIKKHWEEKLEEKDKPAPEEDQKAGLRDKINKYIRSL